MRPKDTHKDTTSVSTRVRATAATNLSVDAQMMLVRIHIYDGPRSIWSASNGLRLILIEINILKRFVKL